MRAQLPTRIPIEYTLIFGVALFLVQQFEHTGLTFSLFFFSFMMVGNLAFNAGGGFSRASGAYVFLYVLLTCVIGVTWKAVIGEPADSNLFVPQLDMACYLASIVMLLVVILLNKMITGEAQGIAPGEVDYTLAGLGCLVAALAQAFLNTMGGGGSGSLLAIVNQLGQFAPLSIILGTIGAIRDSGGRRSIGFVNGFAMAAVFILSMMNFTKQGMLTPAACWLVAAAFTRFRFRTIHYICLAAFAFVAFTIVPLVGEGRDYVEQGAGYRQRAQEVYQILTHLQQAKEIENETEASALAAQGKSGYYNTPQGFVERLSIIAADDTFFNYTNKGHYIGMRPVYEYYENFIPHFILPDKPVPISGNYYAHEIGGYLADNDNSTGISFSPVAEAYHVGGWAGIFLVLPAIWLSLFVSVDYICGDLRRSPWGLLVVVIFAHAAAESLLGSLIWISVLGNLSLILGILFCTRFAPVLGALFAGSNRPVSGHSSLAAARSSA